MPHPDYLYPYLTWKQLLDWQKYSNQFGLPTRRNDLHWGMLQALTYNINRGDKEQPMPPSEFMPFFTADDPYEVDMTEDDLLSKIRLIKEGGASLA